MLAENNLIVPNSDALRARHETYGISDFDKWVNKTEGDASEKPANFAKYHERTVQMLSTALDVIAGEDPAQENFLKNWLQYKYNRNSYWKDFGEKFKSIEELSVLDLGAGFGSLYSAFCHAETFPKGYTAVEPNYGDPLKKRFPEINVVNANSTDTKIPEDIKADIVYIAGVAPYYKWESTDDTKGFKDILTDLESHCEPGGVIVFSFTLDTERTLNPNRLPATLRQIYEESQESGYQKNKSRFTEAQIAELGYSVGPEIFVGTYVAYKKVWDRAPDAD